MDIFALAVLFPVSFLATFRWICWYATKDIYKKRRYSSAVEFSSYDYISLSGWVSSSVDGGDGGSFHGTGDL